MNIVQQDQFKVVHDLLQRQDRALDQLDSLNDKVETAIRELLSERSAQRDEAEALTTFCP